MKDRRNRIEVAVFNLVVMLALFMPGGYLSLFHTAHKSKK